MSPSTISTSDSRPFAGFIVREREPENLEFPFSALNRLVMSNEQFFVRSHFAVPKLDRESWRLRIEGLVQHPYDLTWEEFAKMPSRSVMMTLECAGNSRLFVSP